MAATYAVFTFSDNLWMSSIIGIIWGGMIFNLDRYIVSTIKKSDNFFDELLQATPRIILAMIIAVVIAKPLELKIFEKEINQVSMARNNRKIKKEGSHGSLPSALTRAIKPSKPSITGCVSTTFDWYSELS